MKKFKWLELATSLASLNSIEDLPKMAAVLVLDRSVYVGLNTRKTHPLAFKYSKNSKRICTHAEIAALVAAKNDIFSAKKSAIYIARIDKKGNPVRAKPCQFCEQALKDFNIKKVIWTEDLDGTNKEYGRTKAWKA